MKRRKITRCIIIPKQNHEDYLHELGFNIVCGVDEVGRGSWAGPLVAAAVVLNKRLYGLRDSKMLSAFQREKLAKKIKRTSKWGIGEVSVRELNKLKLTKGTQLAFRRAVLSLKIKPDFVLVDGFKFDSPIPCRALKKGDMICSSIAAASIIAKVYRDKLMQDLEKKYPGYGFSENKGYGTKSHRDGLKKLGPIKIHRMFYKSLKYKNALSNR